MGFVDIIFMVLIVTGALYLLYRSLWKKQGHCPGCDSGTCDAGKRFNNLQELHGKDLDNTSRCDKLLNR